MPSVSGAHFQLPGAGDKVTSPTHPDAGRLSLAAATENRGGAENVHSGFDTVSSVAHVTVTPKGEIHAGGTHVVASQTHEGGNTILHLSDGSKITLVGVTHPDGSIFH